MKVDFRVDSDGIYVDFERAEQDVELMPIGIEFNGNLGKSAAKIFIPLGLTKGTVFHYTGEQVSDIQIVDLDTLEQEQPYALGMAYGAAYDG